MHGRMRRFVSLCLMSISVAAELAAGEVPKPWIDDAQLNDVQMIGSKYAFAVGEHGAIWKSVDGGRKWTRLECGLDVSLRSACFLTENDGWIAGRDVNPYSKESGGVLLATNDSGKTWKPVGQEKLPPLNYVRFFDLEEGVIIGTPTPLSPSGIFKTNDGGQTWRGVPGDVIHPWKAASFVEVERGAVAGINGRVSLMGGDQLFESKLPARGLRSVRAIRMQSEELGWLTGDGGLVLRTSNGGVLWQPPASPLPEELRQEIDFRTIEAVGDHVWLAGSPGSVIWHSADCGRNWSCQSTGQTAPISAIRFSNEQNGIAVGAFGMILRTDDGGTSWQATRGNGRRCAVLSFHARNSQTSAPLIAKLAGESGYRSVVWIAQRDDIGPLTLSNDGEERLQSAVQKCGGHASDICWQLPVNIPGLEYSTEKLTAEWQKQTEGRLRQVLLGTLVRQIRTWRPNVVVIDQPAPDDAVTQLLQNAVQQAIEQASDATQFAEQLNLTGLSEWKVDRVFFRVAPGSRGDAMIDLDEFLPLLKSSPRNLASSSTALLQPARAPVSRPVETPRIAYRLLENENSMAAASRASSSKATAYGSADFFKGLSVAPGSAARREALPFDEGSHDRQQRLIEKQRNFTAFSQKSLDDPRISGQMLGQLRTVIAGMEPQQAATLLSDLADEYRKRSQFEMVEATYRELVHQYPNQPVSLDAMRWLIQFWCSSEVTWQRTRKIRSDSSIRTTNPVNQANYIQGDGQTVLTADGIIADVEANGRKQVIQNTNSGSPIRLSVQLDLDSDRPGGKNKKKSGKLKMAPEVNSRDGAMNEWHAKAVEMAKQLESVAPSFYQSPEIQFPLAAMRRTRGSVRAADAIVRNFVSRSADIGIKQLAERDLWTSFETPESPEALAFCRRTKERPNLDAVLSDACWQKAIEIRLTDKTGLAGNASETNPSSASTLMFCYDDEFLYVAFNAPRAPDAPTDAPQLAGRKHDADLSQHDRISIRFDVDRDYATWYEFQIDQRGWTTESCWEDRRWNTQWFVAADGDSSDWRVEAAIPWNDLVPTAPQPGNFFGISFLRLIPTVGLQTWAVLPSTGNQSGSFALLKFE